MILGKNIVAINQSKEMLDLLFDLEYKIMVTKDCIEGIRHTIRYQPDLVLAEINSPNLNGLSMASILNTLMIRTPLILTASDIKFRKHALSFGNVTGFLVNPGKGTGITRDKARAELESIIFNIDSINLGKIEYSYSFRQHEWANLLGNSDRPKLLVIEDDQAVRLAMLRLLDSTQLYDLYNAKDGLEGVFKAMLIDPQLILTDIHMPKLDGLAMCQIFYILNKPCPIAFVTSLDDNEILQKAKKAQGSIGLLDKNILQQKEQFLEQVALLSRQAGALKNQTPAPD